jgi:hypothetical protein
MDNDETATSPWTRPGFVAAAIVVALVLVLGGVLAIRGFGAHDDRSSANPSTSPSTSADATAPTAPTAPGGGASVCGLNGVQMSGTVSKAPAATWAYQGTTAYPTSTEFGPASTTGDGVRYCFQRSPEGALFAAANALTQAAAATTAKAWISYFLADSPNRDELLATVVPTGSAAATRMAVAGFRVLNYDGQTAHVDLAFSGSGSGQTVYFSAVYPLRWEHGDWKFAATSAGDFGNVVQIPDLAGYVTWRA